VPAEVDVSIRPGWFYHEEENDKVKSGDELFEIYLTSVGRGSTLLLNIPPDKRGLFHSNDLKSLKDFRAMLDTEFKTNLAANAKAMSYHTRQGSNKFSPTNLTDGKNETYWATDDGIIESNFIIDLRKPTTVKYILLQEYIRLGQRVKAFSIEAWINGDWQKVGEGTTIGYKRIIRIPEVVTTQLRINILDARAGVVMSEVKVF
jgi:alpha-L-fucosidase